MFSIPEPFDRTNTARAVHEKPKFDTIQDEFKKVRIAIYSYIFTKAAVYFQAAMNIELFWHSCQTTANIRRWATQRM